MPRLSFCDMETLTEQTIGYVNYSPTSEFVAFTAYQSNGYFEEGDYITFADFFTSSRDFFDLSSGTFTAPAKGTYEFSFAGRHTTIYSENKISVLRKATEIATFGALKMAEEDNLSFTLSIDLNENDTVRLQVLAGTFESNSDRLLVFSGKLLSIA